MNDRTIKDVAVPRARVVATVFAWLLAGWSIGGGAFANDAPAGEADSGRAHDAAGQLDRLELDASAITGNQELPRVMAIVPWKEAGIGELSGKPVNTLLDEVLAPIDREVFQRQVRYFDQLYGGVRE